jgi:two-component system, sensor histidine kinase PdtaS
MNLLCTGGTLLVLTIAVGLSADHLSAQSPSTYYDTAKQRLLALSAAQFITNVTQGEIEPDSAQRFACRIYGLGGLLPYNEDFPAGTSIAGSRLIESGDVAGARRLEPTLKGMDRLRLSLDLGAFYLFKPGTAKSDLDSALFFMQQAVQLGQSPGLASGLIPAQSLLGKYYYQAGQPALGAAAFSRAIATCEFQQDQQGLALAFENAGQYLAFNDPGRISNLQRSLALYQRLGLKAKQIEVLSLIVTGHFWTDWKKAAGELQQVSDLQRAIGFRHTHFLHCVIAYLNTQTGDRIAALEQCNKALESMNASGDTLWRSIVDLRMGSIYLLLGRTNDAITWLEKGLEGPKSRETQPFWYPCYLALLSSFSFEKRDQEELSYMKKTDAQYPALTSLDKLYLAREQAQVYEQLGQFAAAQEKYDVFDSLAARFPPQYINTAFTNGYYAAGNFQFWRGHYEKARKYLQKAKVSASGQSDGNSLALLALLEFRLDSVAGKYPAAIKDFIQFKSLADSMGSLAQKKQINELMIKNETDKKDRNIQLLTQQGRLQTTELYQAHFVRNMMIAGAGLLLIILLLVFYQYQLKQSANRIITKKNHSMERLLEEKEELIADKEILVKEIHHRVKNNLHLISSLLESQSAYLQDEALFAVQKSQHRVQAISLIHQKLYLNEQVTDVEMSIYLREIISYLRDSFVTDENIIFDMDLDPIQLDVTQAVPLGLIVNEAVTNAIKYAFPQNETGRIDIILEQGDTGECRLLIADNGIGLSSDYDTGQSKSLGMSLIKGLSRTLQADVRISSGAGTTIEIIFVNAHTLESLV